MHDVFIVSVPLIIILAGILVNRADAKELRSEMKDLRAEVRDVRTEMQKRFDHTDAHLARIDADLRQFYHLTGKLEGRMDNMEKHQ